MSTDARRHKLKLFVLLAGLLMVCQGCVQGVISQRSRVKTNAIPAHRLPAELRATSKGNYVPLDYTKLRRTPITEHVIGARDVLGIYIEDVLSNREDELPQVFYPGLRVSNASLNSPSVGHPITVSEDGAILLPVIGKLNLSGLTMPEAVEEIRSRYEEEQIITGQSYVSVDLIRPRSVKVFVLREDSPSNNIQFKARQSEVFVKHGSAAALDLPIFENDVLHALAETGGLPGIDAFNEIWILRSGMMSEEERLDIMSRLQTDPNSVTDGPNQSHFVRIPLRVCPGQQLPFSPADVVLNDGDIVFIESREIEFFTTGGLIGGGKYPIPRDHDLDIMEAIAIANGNGLGPSGNAIATNFRSGPGNIVAPTDVVVVRRLPNGEQIKILVDLRIAVNDVNERITVMPRDLILVRYKPSELLSNIALNFINFNYQIPN